MFVIPSVRGAAGALGPASACPVRHSSVALSVSSSVTSIRGKKVFAFVWVWWCQVNVQLEIMFPVKP